MDLSMSHQSSVFLWKKELHKFLNGAATVYIDYILSVLSWVQEHVNHVSQVLTKLYKNQ